MQNTLFFPFTPFFLFFFLFIKKNNKESKTTWYEMNECYVMQILEENKESKTIRGMVTKNIEIKHKDHVRKIQLDRAFCIQNFLNATLALELLFILEY